MGTELSALFRLCVFWCASDEVYLFWGGSLPTRLIGIMTLIHSTTPVPVRVGNWDFGIGGGGSL